MGKVPAEDPQSGDGWDVCVWHMDSLRTYTLMRTLSVLLSCGDTKHQTA